MKEKNEDIKEVYIARELAQVEDIICKVYSLDHTLFVAKLNADGTYSEPVKIKADFMFDVNKRAYEEFEKDTKCI